MGLLQCQIMTSGKMSNSRVATPDFRPNMLEAPSVAKEMKFLKKNPLWLIRCLAKMQRKDVTRCYEYLRVIQINQPTRCINLSDLLLVV